MASSSRAIAGASDTIPNAYKGNGRSSTQDLVETLDEDYESLDETAEEWKKKANRTFLTADEYQAIADEVEGA